MHRRGSEAAIHLGAHRSGAPDIRRTIDATLACFAFHRQDLLARVQHMLRRHAPLDRGDPRLGHDRFDARVEVAERDRAPQAAARQYNGEQHERDRDVHERLLRGSRRPASTAAGCSRRAARTSGADRSSSSGFIPVIFT